MAHTTRAGTGRRPARGSFGQWTTGNRTGAVRDHRGWDAAALAFLDGGGAHLWPQHDTTDTPGDDDGVTTRRPARSRTTRTATRKAGRK